MFKKFDKDSSGTIEFEEFLQALRVRDDIVTYWCVHYVLPW